MLRPPVHARLNARQQVHTPGGVAHTEPLQQPPTRAPARDDKRMLKGASPIWPASRKARAHARRRRETIGARPRGHKALPTAPAARARACQRETNKTRYRSVVCDMAHQCETIGTYPGMSSSTLPAALEAKARARQRKSSDTRPHCVAHWPAALTARASVRPQNWQAYAPGASQTWFPTPAARAHSATARDNGRPPQGVVQKTCRSGQHNTEASACDDTLTPAGRCL